MAEQEAHVMEPMEQDTRIMNRKSASAVETGNGSAQTVPSQTIPAGTLVIHTYRIERLLGSGGMGEVYLARHMQLGTWHAIKVIHPALFYNQQVLDLFQREATVLRGVRHDAIVNYDGFFRDEKGRNYLVMEYVDGPSLADWLKRGPLSLEEVYTLRDRLAQGLAEAHRKGAVHRDLSPDNVILPEGKIARATLIDFGLCKLTDPSQETIVGSSFAGKLRYASPEQMGLNDGAVDARSDIYSLGLLLAASATGHALSMGETFNAVLQARKAVPDLKAVPPSLRDQIGTMLQPDPAHRPRDVTELLRRWPAPSATHIPPEQEPTGPRPGSRPDIPVQERSRTRRRLWLSVAILALTAGIGGGYWMARPPETRIQPPANIEHQRSIEQLSVEPWSEVAPYFREWVAQGQTDEAFALLEKMAGSGRKLPPKETYPFAQNLLGRGRLSDAFALFKVLAADGDGSSALALAKMYDPLLWSPASSPFSRANPKKAESWYRLASDRGVEEARQRLEQLQSWKLRQGGDGKDAR